MLIIINRTVTIDAFKAFSVGRGIKTRTIYNVIYNGKGIRSEFVYEVGNFTNGISSIFPTPQSKDELEVLNGALNARLLETQRREKEIMAEAQKMVAEAQKMLAEAQKMLAEATVKEKEEATRFKRWIFPLGLVTVFLSALFFGKGAGTAEKIMNDLDFKSLVSNAKYFSQAGVGTLVTVILVKLKFFTLLRNIILLIWKPNN